MTSDHQSHAARPTDLVALVTFDDEVRRNEAVTLEGLADPDQHKARPLSTAIAQWLHLGRRMWINVDGRQVRGIATARDLNEKSAWVIDTLIDDSGADSDQEVVTDLLGQAAEAAADHRVTHLLLRLAVDASGREAATRAGFRPALVERLWHGVPAASGGAEAIAVREATAEDEHALFQLYSRTMPSQARALLGMTREEWSAVRDRRWLRGGDELVAERDGEVVGLAGFHEQDGEVQFDVMAGPEDRAAAEALLATVVEQTHPTAMHALVPRCATAVEQVLSDGGLEPGPEFIQMCRRIARPVEDDLPVRAGMPVPSGGGA